MTSRAIFDLAKPAVDTRAAALGANDRRALIVLYLGGGLDHLNFISPLTGTNRTNYAAARSIVGLPVDGTGNTTIPGQTMWQMHPAMYSSTALDNFMTVMSAGKAAVLWNTGPLMSATNRSNYTSKLQANELPTQLYSHSDQSAIWQTGYPRNPAHPTGVMGRLIEMLKPSYNPSTTFPSMYTFNGKGPFSGTFGEKTAGLSGSGLVARGTAGAIKTAMDALRFPNPTTLTNPLMKAVSQSQIDSEALTSTITSVLASSETAISTAFTNDGVGNSLKTALRLCKGMDQLNQRRQIHWITQGGFDQHANMVNGLGDLNSRLLNTSRYIRQVYDEISRTDFTDDGTTGGNRVKVTLLVYSEFGRTFTQNGTGTDHAWGGHAMLVGPDVRGTSGNGGTCLFGTEPILDTTGSQWVADSRGIMIPTTPIDSLYMTISKWLGVPDASAGGYNALDLVCPNYVAGGFTNSGATARDLSMLL
jgi:uncharacterized protein (DUF1501 family)